MKKSESPSRGKPTPRNTTVFGPNAVPAAGMTAEARLGEIAEILALGLQRLLARKSSPQSAGYGESSLDISPMQSGHPEGLAPGDAA